MTEKENAKKLARSFHRNLAFFFLGTSVIYALSGMAFNHRDDWNPDKRFEESTIKTEIDLTVEPRQLRKNLIQLITDVAPQQKYGGHSNIDDEQIKVRFRGAGFILVNKKTGEGHMMEEVNREFFFHANSLHRVPNEVWKWYSDLYACALLLLALTGLFVAKKGLWSTERLFLIAGFIAPIIILNL